MSEDDLIFGSDSAEVRIQMEKFFNSEEYTELHRQLSVNNARFKDLKPAVQMTACFLHQRGMDTALDGQLFSLFYKFKPPTIQEYLSSVHLPDTSQILYPLWRETLIKLFDPRKKYFELILGGGIGLGKCHRAGERVMKFDGSFVAVEELRVGDQLMGPDSRPRNVLALAPGHGTLYAVETYKGEKFYVNGEHMLRIDWNQKTSRTVDGVKSEHRVKREINITVDEIRNSSKGRIKFDYKLIKQPVEFPKKQHVLDPYFIGAMLGDGAIAGGGVVFYTADIEMETWFKEYAKHLGLYVRQYQSSGCQKLVMTSVCPVTRIKKPENCALNELRALELMGKNWNNKSIPESYKYDSRENRLQLLAGLLDTDGFYSPVTGFEFSSKSKQLAEDVKWLARSLGFHSHLAYKETNSQYIQGSPGYRVHISGHLNTVPTKIARKQAVPRVINKNILRHGIKSITALPEQEDWYGFQVDGDHLYLDDDFFVHHNTTVAIVGHCYNTVRVSALINPHATLGAAPNKNIVLSLFTVTLPKARKALVEPFKSTMLESPKLFMEVMDRKEAIAGFPSFVNSSGPIPFYDDNNELLMPNRLSVILGSQTSHALSFDMFGAFLDEAEFRCLKKGTLIKTPNGDFPIESMVDNPPFVYAINPETQKVEIAKASACFVSGRNAELLRVHLDNGKSVDCTPNHKFMLLDGSYVEAQNLSSGQSLKPHYTRLHKNSSGKEYAQTYNMVTGKWEWDHHLADIYNINNGVYSEESKRFHRHHKDFVRFNNNPDNIVRMSPESHIQLHKDHAHEVVPAQNRKRWKDNRQAMIEMSKLGGSAASKLLNNKLHPNYESINLKRSVSISETISSNKEKYKSAHAKALRTRSVELAEKIKGILVEKGYNWLDWNKEVRRAVLAGDLPHPPMQTKKYTTKAGITKSYEIIAWSKVVWANWKWASQFLTVNHKVVSVEKLEQKEDVYDLTVPGYANFALSSGVFVHNSGDIEKSFEIYSNLKERVRSRFMGSRFTLVTLVSSARYSTGIISRYTSNIKEDDPVSIYVAKPIWEVKSFSSYNDGHFYVLRGTSNHPSKILEREYNDIEAGHYETPEGCALLKVPVVYKNDFSLRIEEAIRNLGGMQTLGADHPFTSVSGIVDENLVPEFDLSAPLGEGIPLISKLPVELFTNTSAGKRLARYPGAKRYVHVDLAETNVAGITMLHKELYGDMTIFVADFTCQVKSPTKIDINAIKNLLVDLKFKAEVNFKSISFDQYQSSQSRQELEVLGVADVVKRLSVDTSTWQYNEASRIVANNQTKVGKCDNLQAQMLQVAIADTSPLIRRGPAGKDQLDSYVGALISAIEDFNEIPIYVYKRLVLSEEIEKANTAAFAGLKFL